MFLTIVGPLPAGPFSHRQSDHNNHFEVNMSIRYIVVALAMLALASHQTYAQGCVAVRGGGMCGAVAGTTVNLQPGQFNFTLGARNFTSYKHFVGDIEQKYRVEQGTEVINHSTFLDLGVSYGVTDRLFVSALLPFATNTRTSMYEHGGNTTFDSTGAVKYQGFRGETSSQGLGDARFSLGYWIFDPTHTDYNYSVALGVKTRSGNFNVTDQFYNQGKKPDSTITAVVDQSIQLGDGGIGVTFDVQGIHQLSSSVMLATSFNYMVNITNTNGVRVRGAAATAKIDSAEFSSADQFGLRIGAFYTPIEGWSGYLGVRAEGIPSFDFIGESQGFRRPGYVVSIEPGISYSTSDLSVFFSAPIAGYRNRTQSYIDLLRTGSRGTKTVGDAAFSDYFLTLGISYRIGGSHHGM